MDCLKELQKEIDCTEDELHNEQRLSKQNNEPLYKTDPHKRRSKRMEFCFIYRELVSIELSNLRGTLLVDGKFLYSPSTGKWRVKGKSKYYRSKSHKQFMEKYVLKGSELKVNKDYDEVHVLKDLLESTRLELIDSLDLELVNNRTIEIQKELLDSYRKKRVSILWGLIRF